MACFLLNATLINLWVCVVMDSPLEARPSLILSSALILISTDWWGFNSILMRRTTPYSALWESLSLSLAASTQKRLYLIISLPVTILHGVCVLAPETPVGQAVRWIAASGLADRAGRHSAVWHGMVRRVGGVTLHLTDRHMNMDAGAAAASQQDSDRHRSHHHQRPPSDAQYCWPALNGKHSPLSVQICLTSLRVGLCH